MSHRQYGLWINGAVERPAENRTYDRYSPATGELVASICLATPENVGKAVASAKAAFKSGVWSKMPAIERGKIIQRFA
ncbi:aldehyde dehydrogenase family protein, partial [Rhizobium laguerreae]